MAAVALRMIVSADYEPLASIKDGGISLLMENFTEPLMEVQSSMQHCVHFLINQNF